MHDQALAVEWQNTRRHLERATADPTLRRQAHRLLWDLCQFLREPDQAMAHLQEAVAENPLFTRPHLADQPPRRSVLALAVPGDYQANLPLDRLLDDSTLLHTLWLADPEQVLRDPAGAIPPELPPVDAVFIAIAEDARHAAALRAADALAAAIGRPVLNSGSRIGRLSRAGTACLLHDLDDAVVPSHHRLRHGEALPIAWPVIIRPLGSHAGDRLELIDSEDALAAYYARHPAVPIFTVARFVDYRSDDGLWRKYRVVFVGGVAYPLHLAIHDDWAVWYYNARMQDCACKQAEEQHFLDCIAAALPSRAMAALDEIARRVGLDYFGLDCSVTRDGRLLVFELETGMIVQHGSGPAAARIRRALERLIDRKRAQLLPGC